MTLSCIQEFGWTTTINIATQYLVYLPLIILVVTNRSYQRDTMKRGSGIRRNSRAFRRHRGVPEAQMHF